MADMRAPPDGAEAPFHSVIVVGAGIAGLGAARELLPAFPNLLLVEAAERVGGRVDQVRGVLPWPVELGPEFIHGANTSLKGLLEEVGCRFTEHVWPDRWYFRQEGRLRDASEDDAEIAAVMERFDSVGQQALPAQDLSAEQWLRDGGASARMLDIADACFANDFGCSLSQLGLRETILENRQWDAGETYLVLDRSLAELVRHLAAPLSDRTRLGWPVHAVQHGPAGATLLGPGGQRLRCRHLIITAPLLALQRGDIAFRPPLPPAKRGALARLKMSNAIKVVIALDAPIWPEGFFDVVCPGGLFPEFWVTCYPAEPGYSGPALHGITGFACGLRAERMSGMREADLVRGALAQLDEIFGSAGQGRLPATEAFVRAHVADWSRAPHIGGAYSYPSLGAEVGDRDALAEPVGDCLFFAGEATHPAVNPCLQAALETGARAAAQVRAAAARTASKL